jgi:hypothetical protein
MERLMGLLSNLKKELSAVVRIANERDLFLALEAENILDSAILSTLASLERKESRWGFWHSRGDYPARNDENWLHHIDIKQNTNTGAPNLLPRPVRRLNEMEDHDVSIVLNSSNNIQMIAKCLLRNCEKDASWITFGCSFSCRSSCD